MNATSPTSTSPDATHIRGSSPPPSLSEASTPTSKDISREEPTLNTKNDNERVVDTTNTIPAPTPTTDTSTQSAEKGPWEWKTLAQNCATWLGNQNGLVDLTKFLTNARPIVSRIPTPATSIISPNTTTSAATNSTDDGQNGWTTATAAIPTDSKDTTLAPSSPVVPPVKPRRRRNNTTSSTPPSTAAATPQVVNGVAPMNNGPTGNAHLVPHLPPNMGGHGLLLPQNPLQGAFILPPIPLALIAPIIGPYLPPLPRLDQDPNFNEICENFEERLVRWQGRYDRMKEFHDAVREENRQLAAQARAQLEADREAGADYVRKAKMTSTRKSGRRRAREEAERVGVASVDEPAVEVASTSASIPSEDQTVEETQDNVHTFTNTSLVHGQGPSSEGTTSSDDENESSASSATAETDDEDLPAEEPSSSRGVKRQRDENEEELEETINQDDDEKRPTRRRRTSESPQPETL